MNQDFFVFGSLSEGLAKNSHKNEENLQRKSI